MATEPVPTWKKIVAAILDFLTIFFVAGYAIAQFTGETTEEHACRLSSGGFVGIMSVDMESAYDAQPELKR